MDENETELFKVIYTRIGMLMEDASIIALALGGPKSVFDEEARYRLGKAISVMSALNEAAEAMQD